MGGAGGRETLRSPVVVWTKHGCNARKRGGERRRTCAGDEESKRYASHMSVSRAAAHARAPPRGRWDANVGQPVAQPGKQPPSADIKM